uniref:C2H2-type domain-containing protein n=1 Tax=Caenorhabditis tropicalis TaxID=1561998 RepID=A0A1I7TJD3_9PELO
MVPFTCKWDSCPKASVAFESIEDLVVHVNSEHIPTIVENEDGDDEIQCRWDNCRTAKSHGDSDKLTLWMKEHFTLKHARRARMFKCHFDGCNVRRGTQKELDSHLKYNHKPKVEKPVPEPKPEKKKKEIPKVKEPEIDCESELETDEEWTDPEYGYTRQMDINGGPFDMFKYHRTVNREWSEYYVLEFQAERIRKKRGQKLTKAQKIAKRKIVEERKMAGFHKWCLWKIDEFKKLKYTPLFPMDPLRRNQRHFFEKYEEKMRKQNKKKGTNARRTRN